MIPPEQRAVLDAYWEMLFREDEMLRQSYTPPIVSLVPRFAAEQEVWPTPTDVAYRKGGWNVAWPPATEPRHYRMMREDTVRWERMYRNRAARRRAKKRKERR